ncbi:hypothetical protein JCM11641_007259 [Rhodosporidiobolus odoratus]
MFPPRFSSSLPGPPSSSSADTAVRSTDLDALLSRVSASQSGYSSDPFSPLFLPPAQRRNPDKRPPLINIGTHARTWAVDRLVEQFLINTGVGEGQVQVLSMGAGTDTRFWRLRRRWEEEKERLGKWRCRRWVEVDFPEATGSKARVVSSKAELKGMLGEGEVKVELGGQGLSASLYALLPGDLRALPSLSRLLLSPPPSSPSADPILDPTLPTLLLLECVLVYLEPSDAEGVLRWFAETFSGSNPRDGSRGGAVACYDPFGLEDSFGQVMRRNLAARSLSLPSASSTPTLTSLVERLGACGIKGECGSLSVKEIKEEVIPRGERDRVARIEQIDEVEELNLVLEHYAVTWGNLTSGVVGGIGLQKE